MEKDLPVVYVPKISCFIVLFFTKMNNIIYSYLYKTRKPKNSYTQIMAVIEKKNQIPSFHEFFFTIKRLKLKNSSKS